MDLRGQNLLLSAILFCIALNDALFRLMCGLFPRRQEGYQGGIYEN